MKYWFNNPAVLSIHWIFREIFWKCAFFFQGRQANLKGHSQLWDRADLDTSLAYYLNLKSNTYFNTCKSRNLLQSSLVFHSIFDNFDTENLFLSISLLILYWLKTVWIACLVICKSGKKWYVMLISISWLCPFIKTSLDKKEPEAEHAAHWDEKHSCVKSHWDPLLTS